MASSLRPMRPEEEPEVSALHAQAFNLDAREVAARSFARPEEVWIEHNGRTVVTTARAMRGGQWYGGRAVPAALVASVVVALEARGRGAMQRLFVEMLRAERAAGMALSVLYPSTVPVYRRTGYELAGIRTRYRVPVATAPSGGDTLQPCGEAEVPEMAAAYSAFAARQPGLLDRPHWWWSERVLSSPDSYAYAVRRRDQLTGYAVYRHERADGSSPLPYYYNVCCRDLVWGEADDATALLQIAAANRQLGRSFSWYGAPADPLVLLFGDPQAERDWSFMWMLRVLDPAAALAGRGYPPAASGTVTLNVRDALLPENDGGYRLELSGGQGSVTRVDEPGVQLDCGTLAAIYSGWLSARDAARFGRLTGASASDLATLEAAFAGPLPWMMDIF